ncbi:E3 ubiquitin-protein ligase RNF14-like [Venturia canescens]|uniref:E3 ubiquitin-protein ligase RNF14-like n=1 Tax=Venturia canescens TaxID=32260 RepID=UPI001C9CA396|nr:E3 ubiquitin-protein ligase RNF14-like [Venturia canescens]
MAGNQERQIDEIEAMSSICEEGEFFQTKGENHQIRFEIPVHIEKGILKVKYSNVIWRHSPKQMYYHFLIRNLPPICLHLDLPLGYPETLPPIYEIEICWLSPWECSLICQKLDEIWADNQGSEILFLWRDFLRNDILSFLHHEESLDVSFWFTIYAEPDDFLTLGLFQLSDERASTGTMFTHPMHYMEQFDEWRELSLFCKGSWMCGICLEEYSGRKSIKFSKCEHIFCKNCTAQYFANKIESQSTKIQCPALNCSTIASNDQIKEICPHLWIKYENCVLKTSLNNMKDVITCPRRFCQMPVIIENDETLARCSTCTYNFCFFCRKVYHGIAPCPMTSHETANLVNLYLTGNKDQKQNLLKQHGRRQIQTVVEEYLSKDYLTKNTRFCPQCETPTEKIEGCNKMMCGNCETNFCWLCGQLITNKNAYDHFLSNKNNACYGRLFEGVSNVNDQGQD